VAVELLIGHQRWLCRDDFAARFVRVEPDLAGEGVLAMVGWRAAGRAVDAGRLSCSDSEGHVLRIAASMAEGVPVDLGMCLSTLDDSNVGLVVDAVRWASDRIAVEAPVRGESW
jgi:hypothetical protein